jgi:hypothetical protein
MGRSQHHFPIVGEAEEDWVGDILDSQQEQVGRMGGALRGVGRIYGIQPAVGRRGLAHTQLCRVGQLEDVVVAYQTASSAHTLASLQQGQTPVSIISCLES